MLEGRCQEFTVESEGKLISRINQMQGRVEGLKGSIDRVKQNED